MPAVSRACQHDAPAQAQWQDLWRCGVCHRLLWCSLQTNEYSKAHWEACGLLRTWWYGMQHGSGARLTPALAAAPEPVVVRVNYYARGRLGRLARTPVLLTGPDAASAVRTHAPVDATLVHPQGDDGWDVCVRVFGGWERVVGYARLAEGARP